MTSVGKNIDSQIEQYFNVRDAYIAYREVRNQAISVQKSLDSVQAQELVNSTTLLNDGNYQLQSYALSINNFCALATSDVEYNQATTRYSSFLSAFNTIVNNMNLQTANRKKTLTAIRDFLQLWKVKLGGNDNALEYAGDWDENMIASWKNFTNALHVMNHHEASEAVNITNSAGSIVTVTYANPQTWNIPLSNWTSNDAQTTWYTLDTQMNSISCGALSNVIAASSPFEGCNWPLQVASDNLTVSVSTTPSTTEAAANVREQQSSVGLHTANKTALRNKFTNRLIQLISSRDIDNYAGKFGSTPESVYFFKNELHVYWQPDQTFGTCETLNMYTPGTDKTINYRSTESYLSTKTKRMFNYATDKHIMFILSNKKASNHGGADGNALHYINSVNKVSGVASYVINGQAAPNASGDNYVGSCGEYEQQTVVLSTDPGVQNEGVSLGPDTEVAFANTANWQDVSSYLDKSIVATSPMLAGSKVIRIDPLQINNFAVGQHIALFDKMPSSVASGVMDLNPEARNFPIITHVDKKNNTITLDQTPNHTVSYTYNNFSSNASNMILKATPSSSTFLSTGFTNVTCGAASGMTKLFALTNKTGMGMTNLLLRSDGNGGAHYANFKGDKLVDLTDDFTPNLATAAYLPTLGASVASTYNVYNLYYSVAQAEASGPVHCANNRKTPMVLCWQVAIANGADITTSEWNPASGTVFTLLKALADKATTLTPPNQILVNGVDMKGVENVKPFVVSNGSGFRHTGVDMQQIAGTDFRIASNTGTELTKFNYRVSVRKYENVAGLDVTSNYVLKVLPLINTADFDLSLSTALVAKTASPIGATGAEKYWFTMASVSNTNSNLFASSGAFNGRLNNVFCKASGITAPSSIMGPTYGTGDMYTGLATTLSVITVHESDNMWPAYDENNFIVKAQALIDTKDLENAVGAHTADASFNIFDNAQKVLANLVTGGMSKLFTFCPPANSDVTNKSSFIYPSRTYVQGGDWTTYPTQRAALDAFEDCLMDEGVLSQNLVSNSNVANGASASVGALQKQLELSKQSRDLNIQTLVSQFSTQADAKLYELIQDMRFHYGFSDKMMVQTGLTN